MFECHKLCIEISASAWNDKSSENLFTYQRSITSSGITFWSYLFFWPDTDFSCFPKTNARDSAFIGIESERRCLCCLLTPFRVINYLTIFELDFANGIDRTTRNRFFFLCCANCFILHWVEIGSDEQKCLSSTISMYSEFGLAILKYIWNCALI